MELIFSFPALLKRTSVMLRRLTLALLAAAAPAALAQRHGGSFGGVHVTSGFRGGATFAGRNHPFGGRGFFLGGEPFFYADYPFDPLPAEPTAPQVMFLQPAAPAEPPETRSEPLLIELHGDRYERVGGVRQSAEHGISAPPDYADAAATKSAVLAKSGANTAAGAAPKAGELPPAVLVYRDGHREQVPDYAIVGGTIYARGDYWQNGYWTKNIQISALNIPATMKANQDSGVKFVLPSGPNEVVTRP